MPKFLYGNMFDSNINGIKLATTNSIIKTDGTLVMGAGAAKELRDLVPGIDLKLGNIISKIGQKYGIIIIGKYGAFQTKYHFNNPSPIELIEYSTNLLIKFATIRWETVYNVNYPGVNHGGLTKEIVAPIIEKLPYNVNIWEYKV